MNHRPSYKQAFLEIVGRELDDSERRSIPTLNDVPQDVLEIAREMWKHHRMVTVGFINFMVDGVRLGDAMLFVEDVVVGGCDAASRFVGDHILVRSPGPLSPSDVTTGFFEGFEAVVGERWYRSLAPRERDTGEWSYYGAVGVLQRNAKYWRPAEFRHLGVDDREFVEDARVLVAHRRWLARRLGAAARDYLSLSGATREGVIATVKPVVDFTRVTDDAWIAAEALIREAKLGAPTFQRDRGFLGPDAWYGG